MRPLPEAMPRSTGLRQHVAQGGLASPAAVDHRPPSTQTHLHRPHRFEKWRRLPPHYLGRMLFWLSLPMQPLVLTRWQQQQECALLQQQPPSVKQPCSAPWQRQRQWIRMQSQPRKVRMTQLQLCAAHQGDPKSTKRQLWPPLLVVGSGFSSPGTQTRLLQPLRLLSRLFSLQRHALQLGAGGCE